MILSDFFIFEEKSCETGRNRRVNSKIFQVELCKSAHHIHLHKNDLFTKKIYLFFSTIYHIYQEFVVF